MTKGKLKAYIVTSQWNENGDLIIWAESSGKAKASAINSWEFDTCDYIDLRAKRIKDFDKYADSKKVPIEELLERGWWFYCDNCGCENLTIEDVQNGEAFITDKENSNEIQGGIICAECKKKLEERLACG